MPRPKKSVYTQRTDLNQPSTEPVTAVPGQQYGMETQQRNAQRAVPIGSTPMPAPSAAPSPSLGSLPKPGTQPFLEPTNRPEEPVTAGLPFGPGPGPTTAANPSPMLSSNIMDSALRSGSDSLANIALGLHSLGM